MNAGERKPLTAITGTLGDDIHIDVRLVAALLEQQHPSLTMLPLRTVEAGWDNAMFRLGESFAVRLPRRAAAAALILTEQRWLFQLSDALPLPTPVPLRIGLPGCGYPWRWSVVPWFSGIAADVAPPSLAEAVRLGEFLRALHVPAPVEAPSNPYRGVPLSGRAASVEERMLRLSQSTDLITPHVHAAWLEALDAEIDVEATWIHGDLHPRNVLTLEGKITGIIDWGDMTCGDCATDLACLWMLLTDPAAREVTMCSYRPTSPATWARARGWAIFFGVMLLDTGLAGNARDAAIGEQILRRV